MSVDAVLCIIVEPCIERAPLVAEQASQAGCLCRKLLAHLLDQQCPQLPLLLLLPLQLLLLLLLDVLNCLSSPLSLPLCLLARAIQADLIAWICLLRTISNRA